MQCKPSQNRCSEKVIAGLNMAMHLAKQTRCSTSIDRSIFEAYLSCILFTLEYRFSILSHIWRIGQFIKAFFPTHDPLSDHVRDFPCIWMKSISSHVYLVGVGIQ